MKLFDILKLELPSLKPEECKIHLASWNGRDDPLDVFVRGEFPEWQNWQSNKNFERPYIVSLIKMDGPSRWLFAGVFSTHGCSAVEAQQDRPWEKSTEYRPTTESKVVKQAFRYDTKELPEFAALTGRLIIEFSRPGRQSYLKAENWAERLQVSELKPRPVAVEEFPGFSNVLLPKWKLDIIVAQEIESWKSALSSVAGVYLITDTKTGRHYVGSAYGTGGIWGRWKAYSEDGHGNNKNLKSLLQKEGVDYSLNFQFSILETADTSASEDDVLKRETHWKNALCSRESHGGYNAN
ncbi:MAG: GIY-YIG nuclease family protein [Verrucomicrobia bacterium]|nr:GIY-YIG nuclease family protein [Verrucomicrobiota bacterium]